LDLQTLQGYLVLSGIIFAIGAGGVLLRRSPLAILMCVELMWNAANIALIAAARYWGSAEGHVLAFLVITVAAAEVAIGLAIIVLLFRKKDAADVDDLQSLKG